jgi:hypothetical protein
LEPFFKKEGVNTDFLNALYKYGHVKPVGKDKAKVKKVEKKAGLTLNEIDMDLICKANDNDTIGVNREGYRLTISDEKAKLIVGRFKKGQARLVGKIVFQGVSSNGKIATDSIYFNCIQSLITAGIGDSGDELISVPYNIHLDASNKNYDRQFLIQQKIASGQSLSFKLKFYSGASAYHYFDLIFHFSDNQTFKIPSIFLHEIDFIPVLARGKQGKFEPYKKK